MRARELRFNGSWGLLCDTVGLRDLAVAEATSLSDVAWISIHYDLLQTNVSGRHVSRCRIIGTGNNDVSRMRVRYGRDSIQEAPWRRRWAGTLRGEMVLRVWSGVGATWHVQSTIGLRYHHVDREGRSLPPNFWNSQVNDIYGSLELLASRMLANTDV